jgi:hypothetical protein
MYPLNLPICFAGINYDETFTNLHFIIPVLRLLYTFKKNVVVNLRTRMQCTYFPNLFTSVTCVTVV